jgi:head-tail adaptor
MPPVNPIGRMTEPLTIQSDDPPSSVVSSLSQTAGRADAVTATPHGLTTGDYVAVRGAMPLGYNGEQIQIVVTGPTSFSYDVADTLDSPASGSITVDFRSDSQGGSGSGWWDVGVVYGQVQPLTASERLAAEAVASIATYRVTIHYQPDLWPHMRLKWTKFQESAPTLLEIAGVLPHADPAFAHRYLILECGEVQGA